MKPRVVADGNGDHAIGRVRKLRDLQHVAAVGVAADAGADRLRVDEGGSLQVVLLGKLREFARLPT